MSATDHPSQARNSFKATTKARKHTSHSVIGPEGPLNSSPKALKENAPLSFDVGGNARSKNRHYGESGYCGARESEVLRRGGSKPRSQPARKAALIRPAKGRHRQGKRISDQTDANRQNRQRRGGSN
jgi:hypothetical protein